MEWWAWAVLGLVFFGGEVITPGAFFLLFFGIGALLVAVLTLIGLSGPLWCQWLLFSLFSVVFLVFLRRRVLSLTAKSQKQSPDRNSVVGEKGVGKGEIAPGGVGQIELRGTVWGARNIGVNQISHGTRVVVVKMDGLQLEVRREDEK